MFMNDCTETSIWQMVKSSHGPIDSTADEGPKSGGQKSGEDVAVYQELYEARRGGSCRHENRREGDDDLHSRRNRNGSSDNEATHFTKTHPVG